MSEIIIIEITSDDISNTKRLDQFLSLKLKDQDISRSQIKAAFEKGNIIISVDSKNQNVKLELKSMPKVPVTLNITIGTVFTKAKPENIPLNIVFEDEHLMFINKPAGIVTHPAPGNYTGTLVNAILHNNNNIENVGDDHARPGIVHRLDKGTSGVMVIAKHDACMKRLIKIFSEHDINRIYEAFVIGNKMPKHGIIKMNINRHPFNKVKMAIHPERGKEAITHYKVLNYYENYSHLELKLETGRTHQIRVHLASILNAPILSDTTYGNPKQQSARVATALGNIIKTYRYPMLHARTLGFTHPMTKEYIEFSVEYPKIFQKVLAL